MVPFAGSEDFREDSVETLQLNFSLLKENFSEQVDDDITVDRCIDFNIDVSTTQRKLGYREILAEVTDAQEEDYHKEEDNNNDGKTITNQESRMQEKQYKLWKI